LDASNRSYSILGIEVRARFSASRSPEADAKTTTKANFPRPPSGRKDTCLFHLIQGIGGAGTNEKQSQFSML